MSTQVFLNLLCTSYKDQESKFGGIKLHTGPPSAPGLINNEFLEKANFAFNDLNTVNKYCCSWFLSSNKLNKLA